MIAHDGKQDEIVLLHKEHEETPRRFDVVARGAAGKPAKRKAD